MPLATSFASAPTAATLTRAEIVQLGQVLPPAPRIIAQLNDMLSDVNTDISDIGRLVKTDPGLAARVIRLSKAVMFGGAAETMDVEQALARVGFTHVIGLVGTAGITQLASAPLLLYGIDLDTFQRCSLCHALAAEHLARALGHDGQAAYLAALLRGCGMIVLDRAARAIVSDGNYFDVGTEPCYEQFERRLFGLTSVDATRILLDEWEFPGAVVRAVEFHHLSEPEALADPLACILNVSGEIAAAAGHGLPGDEMHWAAAPAKYEVLGISLEFWHELCRETHDRFIRACEALKAG